MSVVEIHPEDLLDKFEDGSLSEAEAVRLSQHVKTCAACRFEMAARHAFAEAAVPLAPGARLLDPHASDRTSVSSPEPQRGKKKYVAFLAVAAALLTGASFAAIARQMLATPASPPVAAGTPTGAPLVTAAPRVATRPSSEPPRVAPDPAATVAASAPVASRASSVTSASRDAASTAGQLFEQANRARQEGDMSRAVMLYRRLESEYPRSEEATLSRATLARLLLDHGDPRAALRGFDRYLAEGDPALAEEALVGRALALQKLGVPAEEATAWRRVLQKYPNSVHARVARARLQAIEGR